MNIEDRLKRIEEKLGIVEDRPVLTDPKEYTDIADPSKHNVYRRIGNTIEFTGIYPPKGIDIITNTLTFSFDGLSKTARVIGWETNKEYR